MIGGHSATRAELSRILGAESSTTDESPRAPDEAQLLLLYDVISQGTNGSREDVRAIYDHLPLLIERFFGFSTGCGWLETGSDLPSAARDALMSIVMPTGPVVGFCRAHSPPAGSQPGPDEMRYEFKVSNLPPGLLDEIHDIADGGGMHHNAQYGQGSQAILTSPHPHAYSHGPPPHSHGGVYAINGPGPFLPGGRIMPCVSATAATLSVSLQRSDMHDVQPEILLLTPLEYFYLCVVLSPALKWSSPQTLSSSSRRPRARRSTSLPSVRAMYNTVLAAYMWAMESHWTIGSDEAFLAGAALDILFTPIACAGAAGEFPEPSTAVADAIASILFAMQPSDPNDLRLSSSRAVGHMDPSRDTLVASFYCAVQDVLRTVFLSYPTNNASGPLQTLAAYVRVFALYLTPWHAGVSSLAKASLFPKPRSSSRASAAAALAPSFSALQSNLSSLSAKLPTQWTPSSVSPMQSPRKSALWKDAHITLDRAEVDRELLRSAIIKCAHCRLGTYADGIRALSLLSEAVKAANLQRGHDITGGGLSSSTNGHHRGNMTNGYANGTSVHYPSTDTAFQRTTQNAYNLDELRGSLRHLADQIDEAERRPGSTKSKPFLGVLASAVGVRFEQRSSVLSGVANTLGMGAVRLNVTSSDVQSSVPATNGTIQTPSSNFTRTRVGTSSLGTLRNRRKAEMLDRAADHVPVLGSVWDRPFEDGEWPMAVVAAYRLALWLEPALGYVPNTRFAGRTKFVCTLAVAVTILALLAR